jgi:methylisocitrate lyase
LKRSAQESLRHLIGKPGITIAPGVFLPVVAMLAERKGFKALYFSGGGFANTLGLPDLGITTATEVFEEVRKITRVTSLPLIVDADTGFGETLNVSRTVALAEEAGVAAIHIEDQVMPKRCGHLPDKQVVPEEEMVKKIVSAKRASNKGLVLIARTDSRGVEGFDSAVERSRLYVRAGADMVFPEALESEAEFTEFAKKVDAPLLANMTEFGKTPYISAQQFEKMGYKVVIFPITALRAALKTVDSVFSELLSRGTQKNVIDSLMTRGEMYDLIHYYSYERQDKDTEQAALSLIRDTDKIKKA